MNDLPPGKCNLYHPYFRWCRKACRYLREILTYRDQRSRCVILVIRPGVITVKLLKITNSKNLPYGKYLKGEGLKKDIENIFIVVDHQSEKL